MAYEIWYRFCVEGQDVAPPRKMKLAALPIQAALVADLPAGICLTPYQRLEFRCEIKKLDGDE